MKFFRNTDRRAKAVHTYPIERSDGDVTARLDGGRDEHVVVSGRGERWLARWRRIELVVGLLLVAAGFVAVGMGWYDASGTPDVRRQMQALISGGFGGLAAVVLGAAVLQAHVHSRGSRQLADKLDGVTSALLELAMAPFEASAPFSPTPSETSHRPHRVLASHASYHAAGCDLTAGRDSLREISRDEADAEGLSPCSVCLPSLELVAR